MIFRGALLSILVAISPVAAAGQRPSLQLLAGMGINGVRSQPSSVRYSTLVLPRLSAGLRIPLTRRVAILTGADLQQKGFRSSQHVDEDEPGDYMVIDGTLRYSQLHIPLQVSIDVLPRGRSFGLELAAGMSYGFMMNARGRSQWNHYRKDRFVRSDEYRTEPRIALLPYDNRITVSPGVYGALYIFNPALAASLTLRAKDRFLLQAYAEYNLYDASSVSVTRLNLYTVGLALGYRI